MSDFFEMLVVLPIIFIGLPWLILHYVTKWKQAPKITVEDEQLLDDMFNLARRLEERLVTVERIAGNIGAEISRVDLSAPLDAETVAEIRALAISQ